LADNLKALADKLAQILGGKGKVENGVILVDIERHLNVEIKGVKTKSPLVQQIEVSFEPVNGSDEKNDFLNLAEAVLLTDDINKVISGLRTAQLDVTALHNHWLFQQPDIWYLHWLKVMPPVAFARLTAQALSSVKR
jgi:hypothetical protein